MTTVGQLIDALTKFPRDKKIFANGFVGREHAGDPRCVEFVLPTMCKVTCHIMDGGHLGGYEQHVLHESFAGDPKFSVGKGEPFDAVYLCPDTLGDMREAIESRRRTEASA